MMITQENWFPLEAARLCVKRHLDYCCPINAPCPTRAIAESYVQACERLAGHSVEIVRLACLAVEEARYFANPPRLYPNGRVERSIRRENEDGLREALEKLDTAIARSECTWCTAPAQANCLAGHPSARTKQPTPESPSES